MKSSDMSKKELVLIPCSGSKNPGEEMSSNGRVLIEELPSQKKEGLKRSRKRVADSFEIEIDDKRQKRNLMPAYKRYSGNIYNKITKHGWNELENRDDQDLVIISALYGMIYWDESIIDYDVAMGDNIMPRRRLNTWWKKNSLPDILHTFIDLKDFDIVRSFLSGDYQKSVIYVADQINATWLQYEYPNLGSGSNYYRGTDVMNVMLNRHIECPECGSRMTKRVSRDDYTCTSCGNDYRVR